MISKSQLDQIHAFIDYGATPHNHILRALLGDSTNRLLSALIDIQSLDVDAIYSIKEMEQYIFNYIPKEAHGSPDAVRKWRVLGGMVHGGIAPIYTNWYGVKRHYKLDLASRSSLHYII